MRKIKNVFGVIFMAYIIFANSIVSYSAEESEQGYYLLYMYDQDNSVTIKIGTSQIIKEQAFGEINLDNLILFPIETGVYHPFQMRQMEEEEMTREIREYLLYAGYAKIDEEAIAESYELEAQEHARENSLGGWYEEIDNDGQKKVKLQKEMDSKSKITPADVDEGNAIIKFFHKVKVKLILAWSLHKIPIIAVVVAVIFAIVAVKIKLRSDRGKKYHKRKSVIKKRYKQALKEARDELKDSFVDTLDFDEESFDDLF